MSCSGCGSEFGIFKKEHSCKQCGFIFCGKCVSKKVVVPKIDEHKHSVCNACYDLLTSGEQSASKNISPPLTFRRRIEALNGSIANNLGTKPSLKSVADRMISDKDKEIAERLQKLKRQRAKDQLPSQTELEERLAKLKGMDPSKFTAPPIMVYRPPDKRTPTQQASDLIKQFTEELKLDSQRPNPEDEIATRLAKLRGDDTVQKLESENKGLDVEPEAVNPVPSQDQSLKPEVVNLSDAYLQFAKESSTADMTARQEIDHILNDSEINAAVQKAKMQLPNKEIEDKDDDDDKSEGSETDALIEKLLAESALEEDLENNSSMEVEYSENNQKDQEMTEELPWCSICTEDANLRCFGCDGDLYCLRCFKECHDSLDIKDHKTCPYKPPKV